MAKLQKVSPGERLRLLRALEVLEMTDSAEGRRVLDKIGRGSPGVWLTEEAKASLKRLARPKAAER